LTAAAYALMQELRARATGTRCERAQVSTLRERLLKLGVWVSCSVRRIVLHLPQSAPWRSDWCRIAQFRLFASRHDLRPTSSAFGSLNITPSRHPVAELMNNAR
jgi:hypothetical protein